MAPNYEDLTVWSIASLTAYFKSRDFGVPVEFAQQALEKEDPKPHNILVVFEGPDWSRRGTKNERLGVIYIRVFVNTTYVPTDIYYHTRIKAKVMEAMMQEINLKRIGAAAYDQMIIGKLRPVPSESIKVTLVSVEEPDGSVVEGMYCIDLC